MVTHMHNAISLISLSTFNTTVLMFVVINLIPVPPFSGGRIWGFFMSDDTYEKFYESTGKYQLYFAIVVLLLVVFGILPISEVVSWINKGLHFATGFIK
jgi:Zn-dependent protease